MKICYAIKHYNQKYDTLDCDVKKIQNYTLCLSKKACSMFAHKFRPDEKGERKERFFQAQICLTGPAIAQ